MPRRIVPLTDKQVEKAKPQAEPVRLYDGDGLYLLITPAGGKLWRFKYRFRGKERRLAQLPHDALLERKIGPISARNSACYRAAPHQNAM